MAYEKSAKKVPLETFAPGLAVIFARVNIGATGAPTIDNGAGVNFTIARTGVGAYTITLDRKYLGVLFFCGTLEENATTGDDLVVKMVSESVATNGQILFTLLAASTETEAPNGAKLRFMIVLQDNRVV